MGNRLLSELFDGRSQLIVYHFMFDPVWEEACLHCSFSADNFNGIIVHLNQRDVTMIALSGAPYTSWLRIGSGWAGISNGFPLGIRISISITTSHSLQKN